ELETSNVKDSMTYSQEAGTIRKNGYIVIKGRPCKVVEASTSKLANVTALPSISSLPTSLRISFCLPTTVMYVPHVNYTDYTFLYIFDDGFLSLPHAQVIYFLLDYFIYVSVLTENGPTKDDLKLPTDESLLTQINLYRSFLIAPKVSDLRYSIVIH
ncbi:hypothetical protein HID58_029860, partial [Brassica napus]